MLGELVAITPATAADIDARITVTLDPHRAAPRPVDLLAAVAEVARWLPGVETALGWLRGRGARPRADRVGDRADPGGVRPGHPPRHRPPRPQPSTDRGQLLAWADAGPVAAVEGWETYRHDSGVSVSWALREAPRQAVAARVLAPLLAPGPYPRRVTWLYEPYPADQAAQTVEAQVTAGQIRSALGRPHPPRRDPTRPRRPGPRRAVRPRGGRRRRGRPVHRLRHHHRHRPRPTCPPRSPTSSSAPGRPSCGCAACAGRRPAGSPPPSASGSTPPSSPTADADDPPAAHRRRAAPDARRRASASGRHRVRTPTSPRRHQRGDRRRGTRTGTPPGRHLRPAAACAARSGRPAEHRGRPVPRAWGWPVRGGRSGRRTSRPGPATPAPPASCVGCSRSRSPPGADRGRGSDRSAPAHRRTRRARPGRLAAHRAGVQHRGVGAGPTRHREVLDHQTAAHRAGRFGMDRGHPRRRQGRVHPADRGPRRRGVADRPRPHALNPLDAGPCPALARRPSAPTGSGSPRPSAPAGCPCSKP